MHGKPSLYKAASLLGNKRRDVKKQGQWQVKRGNRERKYFQGHEHGTVRGTKSVDLAVTSEIVRCSYITRPLNFCQGQQGDRLNRITVCLFAVSGYLTPPILSSKGPRAQGGVVFPQRGRGSGGGHRETAFTTRSHQTQISTLERSEARTVFYSHLKEQ